MFVFICKMAIMSNPCVLPGKASLSHYMIEEGGMWLAACHLYDHLTPFLFGEDVHEVLQSFPSAHEVPNRLSISNGESRQTLVRFLLSVRMRAVRDIAINFHEEFV